jgi:hypothetical protein
VRLWELGSGLIAQPPIERAAPAPMQRLHESTRETVSLFILSGDDVLFLDEIISPRPIRFQLARRQPCPGAARDRRQGDPRVRAAGSRDPALARAQFGPMVRAWSAAHRTGQITRARCPRWRC